MQLTATDGEAIAHHGLRMHEVVLPAVTDSDTGLSSRVWRQRLESLGPNELPSLRGPGWGPGCWASCTTR